MPKTFASLFSGFGGADIGAKAAGLELAWGVELLPEIAEVANANLGKHITIADILDCNATEFERVDVLHASPPCPNFSVAKAGGVETDLDKALARKVATFIAVLKPQVFTLENVQAYQKSQSWHIIENALHKAGYWLNVEICNSADYGVAQTRKRMIVRAIRGGFVPYLPEAVPWVGWYAAIEDILHTLPESQFAPWQMARLPEDLRTMLVAQGGYDGTVVTVRQDEPSFTVTANSNQTGVRALLVSNAKTEFSDGTRDDDTPAFTVTGESNGRVRALLMDLGNTSRATTVIDETDPSMTITSWHGRRPSHMPIATTPGSKVVSMTPRALARFQSFPDNYVLPESKTLAAKGIGNAVPPLMYQKVLEGLITQP